MFNLKRTATYNAKTSAIGGVILLVLGALSVMAVFVAALVENAPLRLDCPEHVELAPGTALLVPVRVMDPDGTVVRGAITSAAVPGITLQAGAPAPGPGGMFTVTLAFSSTLTTGLYDVELTFFNNETPLPKTGSCRVAVTAISGVEPKVQRAESTPERGVAFMGGLVLKGMAPGLLALGIAIGWVGQFVHTFYGLESWEEGVAFLKRSVLGQASFRPFVIIEEGKIGFGDGTVKRIGGPGSLIVRRDSAVVLERGGKLTRVVRGPAYPRLQPFEKIWDTIDLRPQRWVFKVSAITHDGIPINYEADVQFKVAERGENEPEGTDRNVLTAATCKWIRTADNTEAWRLMTWPKRMIISATEGGFRGILARYELDQLLDRATREQIHTQLEAKLRGAAPNFGLELINVELGDVEFRDEVLQRWSESWQAEKNREVQRIKAEGRARRIQVEEAARNQIRQQMLEKTVDILAEIVQDDSAVPADAVVLSFIEMIRRADERFYLPDAMLKTLDNLQQKLTRSDSRNALSTGDGDGVTLE